MNTKDKWETVVTIHDEIRSAIWGAIFPGARVPVKSIVPVSADLPGMPGASVYLLDVEAISKSQLEKLVGTLADQFNLGVGEVLTNVARIGVPILADDTSLESSDHGQVIALLEDSDEDLWLDDQLEEDDDDGGDDE